MAKTALITGASSGIGLELARIHAATGGNLILVARNKQKLDELKSELESKHNVKVVVIGKDLSDMNAASGLYDEVKKLNVNIDYLINNAGYGNYGFFVENDWQKELNMIQLNIITLTHLNKLFLPNMINQGGGRIMNVASTGAFQPVPLMAMYAATKAYVLSLSDAVNNEVRSKGVTITALCPGPTESGFADAAVMTHTKMASKNKYTSSREVAEYGYKAMLKGMTVAIHGFKNRIMAGAVRFTPRALVVKMSRSMMEN